MTKAEMVLKIAKLMESAQKAANPATKSLLLAYVRMLRQRLAWAK